MYYLSAQPRSGYNPAFSPDVVADPVTESEIYVDPIQHVDPPPLGINSEQDYNPVIDPLANETPLNVSKNKLPTMADERVIQLASDKEGDFGSETVVTTALENETQQTGNNEKKPFNWLWVLLIAIVGYFVYKKYVS